MNKILLSTIAAIMSISMFSSCSLSKKEELSAEELAERNEIMQNDYRGGIIRTKALRKNVLSIMDDMKQNNVTIREDNPNSFWSQDGYQDFVVDFLNADIINDTQWFCEEEYSWEEIMDNISSEQNSFTYIDKDDNYNLDDDVTITRNEKDDYSITCAGSVNYDNVIYDGTLNYHVLYDCDKDWCKAYAETNFNSSLPAVTTQLYEYARIDNNTFAIQTSKERLVVVFEDASEDIPLNERKLKEFYYSKLTADGERTTFDPYKQLPEYTVSDEYVEDKNAAYNSMMSAYPFMNDKGDIVNLYGKNNSIFLSEDIVGTVNGQWAFEDKSLQQAIAYKDGALVVITYNKLSENYERFIYTLDGTPDSVVSEIEEMVEIKDLVGNHKPDDSTTIDDSNTYSSTPSTSSSNTEESFDSEVLDSKIADDLDEGDGSAFGFGSGTSSTMENSSVVEEVTKESDETTTSNEETTRDETSEESSLLQEENNISEETN